MAKFYSNENFRRRVVEALRALGHDVLTSYEAGNANLGISDEDVVRFAHTQNRIVLTFNRQDFIKIHKQNIPHSGIVVCTDDKDNIALAERIHEMVATFEVTTNELIRVNRPNVS
jgi:uncharacterized protein with PIN domain